jgi:hypothetical protein
MQCIRYWLGSVSYAEPEPALLQFATDDASTVIYYFILLDKLL